MKTIFFLKGRGGDTSQLLIRLRMSAPLSGCLSEMGVGKVDVFVQTEMDSRTIFHSLFPLMLEHNLVTPPPSPKCDLRPTMCLNAARTSESSAIRHSLSTGEASFDSLDANDVHLPATFAAANKSHVKSKFASVLKFERHGYLIKQGGTYKTWKKRYFVLKNAWFMYFRNEQDSLDSIGQPLGVISLSELISVSHRSSGGSASTHDWCIMLETQNRIFYLRAETAADFHGWMDVLQAFLRSYVFNVIESSDPL